MIVRTVLLSILASGLVHAQRPGPVVGGVVYDSISNTPLAGAVVQAVLIDSTSSSPRTFTALTDASGHYRLADLRAGRFAIGFQHRALDVLGIEAPIRAFTAGDDSITMDLAIPGGSAVRALACGKEQRLEGEGLLAGYVVDARSEATLKGAVIKVRWVELALEQKNYHSVTRVVTSIVDDDGRYRACGVTTDDAVKLDVSMPGYRGILGTITVPRDGAMRQDFHLATSGVSRGSSSMSGRVTHRDGSVVASGRVTIPALSMETPITAGAFLFSSLPSGTWMVEATSLGLEPQSTLVDVIEGAVNALRVTMDDRAQVLQAVSVLGKPGGESKILSGIAQRRRYTNGTVFLPGNDWLAIARDPADLVRDAAGFRYLSSDKVLASGCGFKDIPTERNVQIAATQQARERVLAVYLNGLRVVGGLPELRTSVSMRDVLAVEAYQDVTTAPAEWRTYDACAVIAIWTKR